MKQKSAPGAVTSRQCRTIKEIAPDPMLDSRVYDQSASLLPRLRSTLAHGIYIKTVGAHAGGACHAGPFYFRCAAGVRLWGANSEMAVRTDLGNLSR